MKEILIASFDMEVGGVERSLLNMLENFDYEHNNVDLMLYKHQGDFMRLLPRKHNMLKEIGEYATFRKSIAEVIMEKRISLGMARVIARISSSLTGVLKGTEEPGYIQMQRMWRYSLPFLPEIENNYDAAISYLWPHYFVAEKVKAKKKIAWIHTDYSTISTDTKMDLKMWDKFHHIIGVSDDCRKAFLSKYPELESKTIVIENISSPQFVRMMGEEDTTKTEMDNNSFKILTVARLSYAKGIDNAVKAMIILRERGIKDIKWYVIGFGGDEGIIKELIDKSGLSDSFVLLGKKANPYPYMKNCDLYVQPSRYEGKAVTVTEAQILGKPVIITNYATANSQVNHGIDGIITDLSVEGIAEGIEKLYKDIGLRTRLSNNCMRTNYSNVEELEKLYNLF